MLVHVSCVLALAHKAIGNKSCLFLQLVSAEGKHVKGADSFMLSDMCLDALLQALQLH